MRSMTVRADAWVGGERVGRGVAAAVMAFVPRLALALALSLGAGCSGTDADAPRVTPKEVSGMYRATISKDVWYYLVLSASSEFVLGYSSPWNGQWSVEGRIELLPGPAVRLSGRSGKGMSRQGAKYTVSAENLLDDVELSVEGDTIVCEASRVFGIDVPNAPVRFERAPGGG